MLKAQRKNIDKALKEIPVGIYARYNDGLARLKDDQKNPITLLQIVAMQNLGVNSFAEADKLAHSISRRNVRDVEEAMHAAGKSDADITHLVDNATSSSSNAHAYVCTRLAIEACESGDFTRALRLTVYAGAYLINAGKEYEDERIQHSAKQRAEVRHSAPGGSHAKQEAIQQAWASGKYTSRDRCAEEECGALGMSFSAARKALRNTPEPTIT